jgi:5-formyltetrahydrofolate cyclo-ligase
MNKKKLREHFKILRRDLSFKRKIQAKKKAFKILKKLSYSYKNILSFASMKEEIDIWEFNKFLLREKKLFLTKIDRKNLEVFKVENLNDLIKNLKFSLLQPDPLKCIKVDKKIIDLVLVPAVSFDEKKRRLGYGKGYFDKLLKDMKAYKIGIGFKEQLSKKDLPFEKHDIQLDELLLF